MDASGLEGALVGSKHAKPFFAADPFHAAAACYALTDDLQALLRAR
jgi:hypothetical protein